MDSGTLRLLQSIQREAEGRDETATADRIRVAIALLEFELSKQEQDEQKEPERKDERENYWQNQYRSKINEELPRLCDYIEKGDYSDAFIVLEKDQHSHFVGRSLRVWSIFGMIIALFLEMGFPLFTTAFVAVSAFLISWIFFSGSAVLLVGKEGFVEWHHGASFISKFLFNLLYAAVCGGIMYLFLFILN